MKFLGKTTLASIIWLTAAMTGIAGMPHFTCRCPNGSLKPFCLGITLGIPGGCCSGSSMHPDHSPDGRVVRACCSKKANHSSQSIAGSQFVGSGSCIKTLASPAAFSVSDDWTTVSQDLTSSAFLMATPAFALQGHDGDLSGKIPLDSAPTDLVISLQHLVI